MPLERYQLQLGFQRHTVPQFDLLPVGSPCSAPGGSFLVPGDKGVPRVYEPPKPFSSDPQILMIYNEELYEVNLYPDLAGFADAPGHLSASIGHEPWRSGDRCPKPGPTERSE